jgi:hypothetical protein
LYPDPGTVYAPRFEVFAIDQDGRDVVIEAQASLLSRKERIVRPYVQVGVLESSDTVDADTIWVFEYKGDPIELKRGLRHDIPLDWRFPLLPGLYRVRVGLWDDNFNGFMPMRAHEFTME